MDVYIDPESLDLVLDKEGNPKMDSEYKVRGFIRRLLTPVTGYTRLVVDWDDAERLLDVNYGSDIMSYQGISRSAITDNEIRDIIISTAKQDNKVNLINVTQEVSDYSSRRYRLEFEDVEVSLSI